MNGEGFVVLESRLYELKSKSSILLSIKTTSSNGLIFLAYKDNNFMSIELETGSIVYRVSYICIINTFKKNVRLYINKYLFEIVEFGRGYVVVDFSKSIQ